MPSPSQFPPDGVAPTVWARIEAEANRRAALGETVIQLHIGDAHKGFPAALTEPVDGEERLFPRLNRYGDTFGEAPLRELIWAKVRDRNRLPADGINWIQVTAGATGALFAGFNHLLDEGAEVLTLAPYWSILRNVADAAGVKLIEAPFFDRLAAGWSGEDLLTALDNLVSDRTQALYINTPSNPTGMVLVDNVLERLAQFARRRDLWVFSDEAYEDFIFSEDEHISIGSLPEMAKRTVSVFTFSKCFGSSGIRVGYAVAPPPVIARINRAVVGACYEPPRLGQLYAWRGLNRFAEAQGGFYADYRRAWEYLKNNLQAEILPTISTFYVFVRLPDDWKALSPEAKVERMVAGGVALAPGEYFGRDYNGWARLCFTAAPLEDVQVAVKRLNEMLI